MSTRAEFEAVSRDVRSRVDVLVQLSEVYFLMSDLREKRVHERGGRSFDLLRRATGFELAARLYRLLERGSDKHHHLATLSKMLSSETLLDDLFAAANKSGRKSRAAFGRARDAIAARLFTLQGSIQYQRIEVFRHRFVGHRLPTPGILTKLSPKADVQDLRTKDLRYVIRRVGALCENVAALEGHGGFRWQVTAELASSDAKALWDDPADNPLSFLDKRRSHDHD